MKNWYKMIHNKATQSAEIMIYDEIGIWGITSKDFAKDVKALGDVKQITVRINSPGGSMTEGNAIYNILKKHPAEIITDVESIAWSMASLVAQSGDRRLMAANGLILIHNPLGVGMGESSDLRKTAEIMDKLKERVITVYSEKSGLDRETISVMMDEETVMDSDEALELGFIDEITDAVEIAAHFDLSKYDFKNIPKDFGKVESRSILDPANLKGADSDNGSVNNLSAAAGKINEEENDMKPTPEEIAAAEKAKADEIKAKSDEAVAKAEAADDARRKEIRAVFNLHGDEHRVLMDKCLDEKFNIEDSRKMLLDAIGKSSTASTDDTRIELLADAREKFRNQIVDALQMRIGSKTHDAQNEYRGATLMEIGKACLMKGGVSIRGKTKMEIVAAAFTHSSSDFPYLLDNTANKELRAAYGTFPETWSSWCAKGEVSDFKVNDRIQLGSFNSLDLIPEGGEYSFGSFGEDKETIQAATKGKAISFTRQAMINDDLGGFIRILRFMGRAANRTVGADAYALLQSNPLMNDGIALFDLNDHANLPTGAVPSATSLGAARTLMRKQKDVDENDFLNIQPAYILAGVEQEDTLNVLIASETDPSQANSKKPNPIRNIAELITEPRLGATEWYMIANPNEAPVIEVAFLDGVDTPYLESQLGFTIDGIMWKVRLDYGTAAMEWRGGVKGNS